MPEKPSLQLGQRVFVTTKSLRPTEVGLGIYLGKDLLFLDRGALAVATRFTVEPIPRACSELPELQLELAENVQAYSDTYSADSLVNCGEPGHQGSLVTFHEITVKTYGIERVVVGATYLANRQMWLMLKDLPIPRQNPLALVA